MTQITELPENPPTAQFVLGEAEGQPDLFVIGCAFPHGHRFWLTCSVRSGAVLSPALCTELAKQACAELLRREAADQANFINWASVSAAIQKLIMDWNAKRALGLRIVQ
jgi:hypothetical protein